MLQQVGNTGEWSVILFCCQPGTRDDDTDDVGGADWSLNTVRWCLLEEQDDHHSGKMRINLNHCHSWMCCRLCRCCSVVAWSGASKTSQLSIIFRLIWEQTDSSGSRLTLVSTGRRSSTRMVLRREPMAGSTPTMFSDCLTTLLMGLDTGLWRRVSSRLDHLNPEL